MPGRLPFFLAPRRFPFVRGMVIGSIDGVAA